MITVKKTDQWIICTDGYIASQPVKMESYQWLQSGLPYVVAAPTLEGVLAAMYKNPKLFVREVKTKVVDDEVVEDEPRDAQGDLAIVDYLFEGYDLKALSKKTAAEIINASMTIDKNHEIVKK